MPPRSDPKQLVKQTLRHLVRRAIAEELNEISFQMRLLAARVELHERLLDRQTRTGPEDEAIPQSAMTPILRTYQTLDKSLETLRQLAPGAYNAWREVSAADAQAYTGFPSHSCSVTGHTIANLFRLFLQPLLNGFVLDIGCGPQPVPRYLEGYPPRLIRGIDPLSSSEDHPFPFARGLAEFLPWEDRSFRTVVAATSLDHVLLVDRALHEIRRVLTRDGRFVAWVSFVKGAKRFDPYQEYIRKVDQYHLFHFDRGWFEETVGQLFEIEEVYLCPEPEGSTFYSFRAK